MESIIKVPEPETTTEPKRFLGFAAYYKRCICNFSMTAGVLQDAPSKNRKFKSTDDMRTSFQEGNLKEKLTSSLV